MSEDLFARLRSRDVFLRDWKDLEELVLEIGFLPLFQNEVPGFSAEDYTLPGTWFTGEENDPWDWRAKIPRNGKVAYGKFFAGKAGFVSREWFPVLANYRRDGYDFDALWDDELASMRSKKIMDLFAEENQDREMFTYEIKDQAGFGKEGEKNFEGELTRLEMRTYLVIRDFRQRTRKDGKAYGWSIGVVCTPEHLFGEDFVRSGYAQDPAKSREAIENHLLALFPDQREKLGRLLSLPGEKIDTGKKGNLPFPANLIKAMRLPNLSYEDMTLNQLHGLTVALGQLQGKHQAALYFRYKEGKSYEEIGPLLGKAASTASSYHTMAMSRLKMEDLSPWYQEGFNGQYLALLKARYKDAPIRLLKEDEGLTEKDTALALGLRLSAWQQLSDDGILTIKDLKALIESDPAWYKPYRGIGPVAARDIEERIRQVYDQNFTPLILSRHEGRGKK